MQLRAGGLASLIALLAFACNPARAEIPTSPHAEAIVAQETPRLAGAMAAKGLALGAPIYIAIYKSERVLEVWSEVPGGTYALFKTYPVCDVSGTLGPKTREGDLQAPEGFYSVAPGQLVPDSEYDLAFNLGYPNAYDQAQGHTGAALMVHGSCISVGCYAMTNPGIEEIYTLVYQALEAGEAAVPVDIFPFRMTPDNMAAHADSSWIGFWEDLREGYQVFSETHKPPVVSLIGGRYAISAR